MLWLDKYHPRHLDELLCHPHLTRLLQRTVKKGSIPHMLFYGESGGGKKTRIMAVLRALFGSRIDQVKAETMTPTGTSAEFVCCSSLHHHQISVTELGNRDRVCMQYLIKQLASQQSATIYALSEQNVPAFRVFVIQEAERLSPEAQAALRRTLERCIKSARVILHCSEISAIMPALKSRCFCIRVPLPAETEVKMCVQRVLKEEHVTMPDSYLTEIVRLSGGNIRRAILMAEHAVMYKFPPYTDLGLKWETQCREIAAKIARKGQIRSLVECRELFYELVTSLIPPPVILETLLYALLDEKDVSESAKATFIHAAAHYAFTLQLGSMHVWHLEAFAAQCLNALKRAS